jgi:hypothetical protein
VAAFDPNPTYTPLDSSQKRAWLGDSSVSVISWFNSTGRIKSMSRISIEQYSQ